MCPGSNPGVDTGHIRLSSLLVLSFAPSGFSLGTPVFPSPQKSTFPNSNSTSNQGDEEPLITNVLPLNRYLFIYLFILIPLPMHEFFVSFLNGAILKISVDGAVRGKGED